MDNQLSRLGYRGRYPPQLEPMNVFPEIELSNTMANRIVGSVFWDQVLAVERLNLRHLNVHVVHLVGKRTTNYETQMANGGDAEPGVDAETQVRAMEIPNADGAKSLHFRIQCRFNAPINEGGMIGFDQIGRIVNEFAIVDNAVDVYTGNSGFSPWRLGEPTNGG